jgi:hypothetical protein
MEVCFERTILLRHVQQAAIKRRERNLRSHDRTGAELAGHRVDDAASLVASGIDRTDTPRIRDLIRRNRNLETRGVASITLAAAILQVLSLDWRFICGICASRKRHQRKRNGRDPLRSHKTSLID